MSQVTYREAIRRALADALAADPRVLVLGEDIGAAGGVFKATAGLSDEFGSDRVRDTPISEQAIIGATIGSALKGLRPVAELMFADFAAVCFDQIANQMAKYRYMTGGQVSVPATVRLVNGAGNGFGSQHSQAVENWFLGFPGLIVVTPGCVADAYGLLRAAIADENPVLYFEHKGLYNIKGELPDSAPAMQLGKASVVRQGTDATVVATQLMRQRVEEAAEVLAADGIDIEVVDPRTLLPLDITTIGASVDKTNNLVVVQESSAAGSWGATVVASVVTAHFESLDAAPVLLSAPDTPIPYAGDLEQAWLPSTGRITDAIRKLLAR